MEVAFHSCPPEPGLTPKAGKTPTHPLTVNRSCSLKLWEWGTEPGRGAWGKCGGPAGSWASLSLPTSMCHDSLSLKGSEGEKNGRAELSGHSCSSCSLHGGLGTYGAPKLSLPTPEAEEGAEESWRPGCFGPALQPPGPSKDPGPVAKPSSASQDPPSAPHAIFQPVAMKQALRASETSGFYSLSINSVPGTVLTILHALAIFAPPERWVLLLLSFVRRN